MSDVHGRRSRDEVGKGWYSLCINPHTASIAENYILQPRIPKYTIFVAMIKALSASDSDRGICLQGYSDIIYRYLRQPAKRLSAA